MKNGRDRAWVGFGVFIIFMGILYALVLFPRIPTLDLGTIFITVLGFLFVIGVGVYITLDTIRRSR